MQRDPATHSLSTPFSLQLLAGEALRLSPYDNHIVRRLSAMRGQFLDQQAYAARLEVEDPVLYEVYDLKRPEVAGELLFGLSIVHPGKVGAEYVMTKGHYHSLLETAEVYLCLRGEGFMVMESPEGEWAVETLRPHTILYAPPRWAHRTVNTGSGQDLVTYAELWFRLSIRRTPGTTTLQLKSRVFENWWSNGMAPPR
ncbi:MAG TPA: glucose-6-phosphate isomerase family protein [Anaerolineales bacterium]|nr:glucose-6-phosphate isomerase family protein [Anaerolineales bacterium]